MGKNRKQQQMQKTNSDKIASVASINEAGRLAFELPEDGIYTSKQVTEYVTGAAQGTSESCIDG